jgi:formiminotetrahydrofolate cyclodeaminase
MPADTLSVGAFLDALGEKTPAPASGAAAAITGALGAALAELAARLAKDEVAVERARTLRTRLVELADEDGEAYTAFLRERSEARRKRTIDVPHEIAAVASEVAELADGLAAQLTFPMVGDAEASAELARAAAHVSRRLAALNG